MAGRMVRRADGRYQYAVTMTREDGSRKRIFFYGSTQREARAKADEASISAPERLGGVTS